MRRSGTAALATMAADTDGWPYASLVAVALDQDGTPLLLISRLAEHTSNISDDSRVSLLFTDLPSDGEDPLTGSRTTVVGRAQRSTQPHHKRRFLARHPEAAQYVEFKDFSFFRIEVERTHLVAGFGVIHWIEGRDALIDRKIATAFVDAEDGIVAHMNADHLDAVELYATVLLKKTPGDWCLTGCDADGLDLFERTGGARSRLNFDQPAPGPSAVRSILVDLVHRANSP